MAQQGSTIFLTLFALSFLGFPGRVTGTATIGMTDCAADEETPNLLQVAAANKHALERQGVAEHEVGNDLRPLPSWFENVTCREGESDSDCSFRACVHEGDLHERWLKTQWQWDTDIETHYKHCVENHEDSVDMRADIMIRDESSDDKVCIASGDWLFEMREQSTRPDEDLCNTLCEMHPDCVAAVTHRAFSDWWWCRGCRVPLVRSPYASDPQNRAFKKVPISTSTTTTAAQPVGEASIALEQCFDLASGQVDASSSDCSATGIKFPYVSDNLTSVPHTHPWWSYSWGASGAIINKKFDDVTIDDALSTDLHFCQHFNDVLCKGTSGDSTGETPPPDVNWTMILKTNSSDTADYYKVAYLFLSGGEVTFVYSKLVGAGR